MKNENGRKKDGCSILIPTYNRPEYLNRILKYYSSFGENYNIIVGDSSSDENKKVNEKNISTSLEISVSHINKYPSEINPYYKIADALDVVIDKYCVLCGDDDFITPRGIKMAVEFLEKNPDYTCAHGNYIGYTVKEVRGNQREFIWRPIYPFVSITHDNPADRLTAYLENYYPTFYAVHRTDILRRAFVENLEATDDYRFGELFLSLYGLIHGKMKKIDGLYSAREFLETSTGATTSKMADYNKDDDFETQYTKFRDRLAYVLTEQSTYSLEKSQEVIDMGMRSYLNACQGFSRTRSSLGKAFEKLPLPLSIQSGMKKVINKINSDGIEPWRNSPPSQEWLDEYNKIRSSVLHSYLV